MTAPEIRLLQSLRVPYTPTAQQVSDALAYVPFTWNVPFVDTSYSIEMIIELAPGLPNWQANHVYAANTVILDSNGRLQRITTPGTSGSSQPVWATGIDATTSDNSATWTLNLIAEYVEAFSVKDKTVIGFTGEFGISLTPLPVIVNIIGVHD